MYHFKDAKPMDTVKKIIGILSDIGIDVEHYEIYSGIGELYSYRVEVKGSKGIYGTNGKGITKEYALASAYAELLERIQNNLLFLALRSDCNTKYGFYYSIDEREFRVEELIELEADFLSKILLYLGESCSVLDHLKSWDFVYPNKGRIITFPFTEHGSTTVHYIPLHLVKVYMGSNGMCSGNSKAEALVQGISELFERYAMKRLLSEQVTMPKIPEQEISCLGSLYELVKEFRRKIGFELNFYDASLGEGLPVVAAVCIDRENKKYHVHFGAHPVFAIAVERSFTELMQGQSLSKLANFMNFSLASCMNASDMSNRVQMYINGIAYVPLEFFKDNPSYEYRRFEFVGASSNEVLLEFLIDKINSFGWQLLYRETGFSGFNSYHVYADCMGIYKYDDPAIRLPQLLRKHNKLFRSIRQLITASEGELKAILRLLIKLDKYNIRKRYRLLTNSFLELETTYGMADISVLIVFILIRLGRFKKAQLYLEDTVTSDKTVATALKEYLAGINNGYKHADMLAVLEMFYGNSVKKILEYIHAGKVLELLPDHDCYECSSCKYNESCVHDLTIKCKEKYFDYLQRKREV